MRPTPPTISTLPQELIDQIIDHLHNDILSLKNCSVVCHAWLPTSRIHLFSKIRLDIPRTRLEPLDEDHHESALTHKPCQKLHTLLSQNPAIIPHIHELTLVSGSPVPSAVRDGQYHLLWTFAEETLPLLLRTLTHLQRFEITSPQGIAPWNVLPAPLSGAMKAIFSVPSLAYIRIKSWEFPSLRVLSKLLRQSVRLRGLGLWSIRMGAGGFVQTETQTSVTVVSNSDSEQRSEREVQDSNSNMGDVPVLSSAAISGLAEVEATTGVSKQDLSVSSSSSSTTLPPALEFLTLDYVECPHLVESLVSQLDLTNLRELRIAHSYDKSIQDILNAAGGSLERFHFKPGSIGLQPLDLSLATSLRSIRLTLEEDSGVLQWISSLLYTIPSPSVLERIALELYTDPKRLPLDGWRILSKVIGSSPQFSDRLTHVHIGLFASPTSNEFVRVHEAMTCGAVGVGDIDGEEERPDDHEPTFEESQMKDTLGVKGTREGPEVMVYQLGTKRQSSFCAGLTPLIEKFEDDVTGRRFSGIF
ncbi:hypothetical protein E1B28_000127 [Marasmius oreades]|nr:uncharacterized protein E1B28_000127 [Marasmius oreades]KAG7098157.1 hypothetical protein E1B28_000127 [Marasmius oreades]